MVIKSPNAKSILLQKVLLEVFGGRGRWVAEKSQKHSGTSLLSEMDCVFDVAPSIKTQLLISIIYFKLGCTTDHSAV